jgi:hypothetical protein
MMGGYYTGTTTAAFGGLAAKKSNATHGNYDAYLQFLVSTNGLGNTEKMRIDSSGNLLVGKTSANATDNGVWINNNGTSWFTQTSDYALGINRKTTDGSILYFAKDGTSVGSIGTAGGALYIGSTTGNDSYLAFYGDVIIPSTSAGLNRDNAIDLGYSSSRFKDLYLSGGVYLGGTGSANKLDDYEYGDYQVTFTPSGGGSITLAGSHDDLKYTKIGSRVFISGKVDISAASSPSGYIAVTLPFAIHNSGTANDSRRFNGSIWVINSALNTYEFQLYGVEGESSVRIYNGSGTSLASTSANQFSGNEGVCFNFHYETTP